MNPVYLAPEWFFGYDILLEVIFAIITLALALYSYKLYKITSSKQLKLFGAGFLSISLAYFIQSGINFLIISKMNQGVCHMLNISQIEMFNMIGFVLYSSFFLIGLCILTYMTLKQKNRKALALLMLVTLAGLFLSSSAVFTFYFLASIFLFFIVINYSLNYYKKRNLPTLLVLLSFIFLLFGRVHYLMAVDHSTYYVIGHFLELIAYVCLMINLVILKK